DAGRQGPESRQDAAQAHRDAGRHLPDGGGGQGVPEPQVLTGVLSLGDVVLEARGLTRRFTGVLALSGVDFRLRAGEVHALMGQNGAGKSTLIKILTGVYPPDAGELRLNGETIRPA